MKKLTLSSLVAAALTMVSPFAGANTPGGTFEVSVSGTIMPSACKALLTDKEMHYDDIPIGELHNNQPTALSVKSTGFTISCNGPTRVVLEVKDNRVGTAEVSSGFNLLDHHSDQKDEYFGLGTDDKGNKIGAWLARINKDTLTLDGSSDVVNITVAAKNDTKWHKNDEGIITAKGARYSWAIGEPLMPTSFTNLSGTLEVQAEIQPADALDHTKPIKLDGSASIEIIYV